MRYTQIFSSLKYPGTFNISATSKIRADGLPCDDRSRWLLFQRHHRHLGHKDQASCALHWSQGDLMKIRLRWSLCCEGLILMPLWINYTEETQRSVDYKTQPVPATRKFPTHSLFISRHEQLGTKSKTTMKVGPMEQARFSKKKKAPPRAGLLDVVSFTCRIS